MYRNIPLPPTPDVPTLQYASGRTQAKAAAASRFSDHTGFHSQVGKDADFDETCQAANLPQISIRHMSGEVTTQWSFGSQVRLHVLTAGPPATTISACLSPRFRQATADAGIGLVWREGGKSKMAIRGYLAIGTQYKLVQLSVSSLMTGFLLESLCDHIRVCMLADGLIMARGLRTEKVYPVEVALPLGVGPEVSAGSAATTQIRPLISLHTPTLTKESLGALWASNSLCDVAWADWAAVQLWAGGYGLEDVGVGVSDPYADPETESESAPGQLFPEPEPVRNAAAAIAGPVGRKGRH